jgi:hypothetical protein
MKVCSIFSQVLKLSRGGEKACPVDWHCCYSCTWPSSSNFCDVLNQTQTRRSKWKA